MAKEKNRHTTLHIIFRIGFCVENKNEFIKIVIHV